MRRRSSVWSAAGIPRPCCCGPDVCTPSTRRNAAPPLGVGALTDDGPAEDLFTFRAGDMLLLYTDGVTEARDGSGRFYPLAERLVSWPGAGPGPLVEWLCADLLRHAGGHLGDDAAMVAVECLPCPG